MGTFLKILTVFLFIFSAVAFVLGLKNFEKRELLIGRTHLLEETVIRLGTTLETADPEFDGAPDHVAWDIEEPTARPSDNPETDDFWSTYEDKLEASAESYLRLGDRRQQLSAYYLLNPDGTVKKDFQGRPVASGKGTMRELLDQTVERAKGQLALLNKTRNQLVEIRKKLDEVAAMLNEQKRLRRENLATIEEKNAEIETHKATIAQKETEIARLNREKDEMTDQINSLNETIAKKEQDIQDFTTEIARLKEEIKKLTVDNGAGVNKRNAGTGNTGKEVSLSPGRKGIVKKVDREWAFVIVEFTPEAAKEMLAGGVFNPVELMVYRKDAAGKDVIVTRLHIKNPPNAENMAIADNMYGWEQVPVQPGDEVIY